MSGKVPLLALYREQFVTEEGTFYVVLKTPMQLRAGVIGGTGEVLETHFSF